MLKSNDQTQSAREAWIRRKSYNPMAGVKTNKNNFIKDKQQALHTFTKQETLMPRKMNRAKSFMGRESVIPQSKPLARQLSLSKLNINEMNKENMYDSRQRREEMMFSSLIEIKDNQYEEDEYDDKITELVRPFHNRRNMSDHSALDHLVISTMANLTQKLSRAVSGVLHKAVIMLHHDQEEMVSIVTIILFTKDCNS